MCDPVTATALAVGAMGGVQVYQGEQQRKLQKDANRKSQENADRMATMASEDNNRRNAKAPDAAAMLASATLSGKSGQSGTMLTGPAGVDPSKLLLGRSTLLGA